MLSSRQLNYRESPHDYLELKQSIEEYAPEDVLEEVYDYENPLENIGCDVSGDNWEVETIIANVIYRETDLPVGYFEGAV